MRFPQEIVRDSDGLSADSLVNHGGIQIDTDFTSPALRAPSPQRGEGSGGGRAGSHSLGRGAIDFVEGGEQLGFQLAGILASGGFAVEGGVIEKIGPEPGHALVGADDFADEAVGDGEIIGSRRAGRAAAHARRVAVEMAVL